MPCRGPEKDNAMKPPASASNLPDAAIRDIAARWVVRHDRRLSPAETAELAAWLAADPRHAAAYEMSTASWQRFHQIGLAVRNTPVETNGSSARWKWPALGGLAAAAALVVVFHSFERTPPPATQDHNRMAHLAAAGVSPAIRHLTDGSLVRLRDDAEIVDAFSATERRLRLVRGEAFFAVAKDAARPFFVEVGGVTVRAVGTAFSIRSEPHAVDVLVTEGTVQVTPPGPASAPPTATEPRTDLSSLVSAGHQAVVPRTPKPEAPRMTVARVSPAEMTRRLAWSGSMLELGGATLGELVEAFAQRTGQRLEIAEPALAAVRIGGRFPAEDSDGFVRALKEIYGVESEIGPDGTILLRKTR